MTTAGKTRPTAYGPDCGAELRAFEGEELEACETAVKLGGISAVYPIARARAERARQEDPHQQFHAHREGDA